GETSRLASQDLAPPESSPVSNHSTEPSSTVPRTTSPAPDKPADLSSLTLAMQRAGSYYERGLQAMGNGHTHQAESEFDAALETLLDTSRNGHAGSRRLEAGQLPGAPSSAWLFSLASPPQSLVPEPLTPPDPDEATQEAPALLGPEDVQTLSEEQPEETGALPEPDAEKHDIPIVFNDKVKTLINHFQTRKWGVITRAFERASRHLPMMRRIFREKGLPEDLLNLAFIESAVNPRATSRAKAAGIWQFMPATGRRYGMRSSFWLDERRDPEKSTRAAAEYLKQLYEMFEDWPLALAAYNAGEGKIQAAIKRQRTRDYWRLRLPRETRYFVPAFMAMTIIAREPERYGFSPPPEASPEVDVVSLDQPTDLKTIAEAAATTLEEIRELNPELIRWATPSDMPQYALRIPAGRRDEFVEVLERIPPEQRITWIRHTVRRGETPTSIARRYGVDLRAVLDLNGLRKRHTSLKPGRTLLIPPMPARSMAAGTVSPRQARALAHAGTEAQYTVKNGDTLWDIAQAHDVSLEELRRWNGLDGDPVIRPGQSLKIPGRAEAGGGAPTAPQKESNRRPSPSKRYVVKRGDTLWDIARDYAVPLEELRRVNNLPRDAGLRPGQELTIPHPPS
ncbi:MAG TPA: LysM peptidoglycan-binding domain-containing protein, partial [Candidatus Methylomirabilis sp.]|nr:LysM peptidoglycan-binding domain-containing protein [Candidatus Methylomirabilis sp.]